MSNKHDAIIIGAGPAGLTAALELTRKTDRKPLVLEADSTLGGISRTLNYKGNRIDIGGHRFFSKSERVVNWWLDLLPVQGGPAMDDRRLGRDTPGKLVSGGPDPDTEDNVMLQRHRLSRILYRRKCFDYPISLSPATLRNLGPLSVIKMGATYAKARLLPIKPERSLEDFLINRFGAELYRTFFKDYTQKVWGVDCREIPPEWGAQRIKGVSVSTALLHALKKLVAGRSRSLSQSNTETSLIDCFYYPKFGPGQLWEKAAEKARQAGVEIKTGHCVKQVGKQADGSFDVVAVNPQGKQDIFSSDIVFSSMPLRELIKALAPAPPESIMGIARDLPYRDFMTVGLLVSKMKRRNQSGTKTLNQSVPDNWIYIQEPDVKVGRLQIFNNWSPYLVADPQNIWLGLEYFCNEGDELWTMKDDDMIAFAIDEMRRLDLVDPAEVLDCTVIRIPKAYPAYFGSYNQIDQIQEYLNAVPNLFPIGRNGMHRYNNQDHSMLTAMQSVELIAENRTAEKTGIWDINAKDEYHETAQ
ncbi:MAG: NAD(P)/FAD-dependent oxidoreductase [Desulfovibrionales bacterium]